MKALLCTGRAFDFDMDILITLGIGAAGGLIALVCEHVYLYFKESRLESEKKVVKFSNEERRIAGSVFNYLGPGASVELMRGDLGPPNKKYESQVGLFQVDFPKGTYDYELPPVHAYLYIFKNAHVKVLSRDNETITALTVIAIEKDISMSFLPLMVEQVEEETPEKFFNVAKIDEAMIREGTQAEHFPGCRDVFTAVRVFSGSFYRTYITYFCDFDEYESKHSLSENPGALVGSTINGVCLSARPEDESYIHVSELV